VDFPGKPARHPSCELHCRSAGAPVNGHGCMANKPDLLAFSARRNTAALTAVDLWLQVPLD